ncbi:phage terminase small subunit [Herbaspirillum chlorophenolicum]|uniref:Phage terminase small subunit n=1 Tax=Herbaspirillum chlorophenolicum TaxID=211589 RepID=A0ABW8F104_9BURK
MARLSPAARHRERMLGKLAASAGEPGSATVGTAYELMLAQLHEHRRTLHGIQSIERKIEAKATMLPVYQAWIDGVLSAGKGAQDEVLVNALVWHIDVGDYERALQIAGYAVAHDFTLPDRYNRTLPTLLQDDFAGAALGGKLKEQPERAADLLQQVLAMTGKADTPDQARAKVHKALGLALLELVNKVDAENITSDSADYATAALHNLVRAGELHQAAGVKKEIERLERRLKKFTEPPK